MLVITMNKLIAALALGTVLFMIAYTHISKTDERDRVSRDDAYQVVRAVAGNLIGKIGEPAAKPPETDALKLFYDLYDLDLEIGSGASFDQYFVWASPEQIQRIVGQLEYLELYEHARIAQAAIDVAYPKGAPQTYAEKESEFDILKSREDGRKLKLEALYKEFNSAGHLTEPLYELVVAENIMDMRRFKGIFQQ